MPKSSDNKQSCGSKLKLTGSDSDPGKKSNPDPTLERNPAFHDTGTGSDQNTRIHSPENNKEEEEEHN